MNDFDPIAEIKKNKKQLIGMSIGIFVVTFIIVLIAKGGGARPETHRVMSDSQNPGAGKTILLDYSDPQLPEDRLDMPASIVFFTRSPGTNRLHIDRVQYELDDTEFDAPVRIREKR